MGFAIVLSLASSGSLLAEGEDEVTSGDRELLSQRKVVASELERRQFRIKWWAAHLPEDMSEIYEEFGYPSSRYREEVMGRLVERWTYVKEGRRFTFRDGQLIEEREFTPGSFKGYSSREVRSGAGTP
jgi:hypothetical protein